MLKKITVLLLTFVLFMLAGISSYSQPLQEPEISNPIFLLGALDHRQILYSSNLDVRVYPASTTKMLTALVVLDHVEDFDKTIVVDSESPYLDGSIIALNEGEIISYRDLLSGMLIASGNDAASALAIAIAGSVEEFATLMNEKAAQIGCTQSHFVNPHGLHDDNHYTTAHDLYLIAVECMKNETFREIVATSSYEIQPTNTQPETRYLRTTNSLFFGADHSDDLVEVYGETVQTYYPNAIGIKTGYTEEAMRCLVSAAAENDNGVIAIVMHSEDAYLYQDTIRLLAYGLRSFDFVNAKRKDELVTEIQLNDPSQSLIGLVAKSDLRVIVPKGTDVSKIEYQIQVGNQIAPPIRKEQVLGTVVAMYAGKEIGKAELVPIVDFSGDKLINEEISRNGTNWRVDWFALGKNIAIFLVLWIITYFVLSGINKRRRGRPVNKNE